MSDEKDPAQVLEDAADWLLVNGRHREALTASDGSGCVMWALAGGSIECPNIRSMHSAETALNDHLRAHGSDGYVTWNRDTDDDFTVIDTLRHVAKDLRGKAVPS